MFVVKKSSTLYKFYDNLAEYPCFGFLKTWDGKLKVFSDICTFCRLQLYILLVFLSCYVTPVILLGLTLYSSFSVFVLDSTNPVFVFFSNIFAVAATIILTGAFALLLILFAKYCYNKICQKFKANKICQKFKSNKTKQPYKPSKVKTFILEFIDIVSQKHSKFCKQIKLEDD